MWRKSQSFTRPHKSAARIWTLSDKLTEKNQHPRENVIASSPYSMPLCCHSAALQGHACAHYPAFLLPLMTSVSPRSMTFKDDEFTPACLKDHPPWAIRQAASLLGNLNFTKNLPSWVGPGPPGWDSTALPGRTVLKSLQWKIEPVSGCLLEISTSRLEESNGSQFSWSFLTVSKDPRLNLQSSI